MIAADSSGERTHSKLTEITRPDYFSDTCTTGLDLCHLLVTTTASLEIVTVPIFCNHGKFAALLFGISPYKATMGLLLFI